MNHKHFDFDQLGKIRFLRNFKIWKNQINIKKAFEKGDEEDNEQFTLVNSDGSVENEHVTESI